MPNIMQVRNVLLRPPPAAAASQDIAFVGAADGGNNSGSTSSLTYSYTVGAGSSRLLVAAVIGDTNVDRITGATYNGVAMTEALKVNPGAHGADRWTHFFYLLNPASGAHNIVVSASGNQYILSGAADYSGVNASGQPDASNSQIGSGSTTSLTTSVTTVAANSWIILVDCGFDSNGSPGAGTGATRRTFDAAFGLWGIFDSGGPLSPGSNSMTTTRSLALDTLIHAAVSFKPA